MVDFLNDPERQKLLGIEKFHKFESINFPLNFAWAAHPEINLPTTRQASYLLDQGHLRLLVVNGNYDVVV